MIHLTHLSGSAEISIFSPEISIFCYIKKYSKKYRYRLDFKTQFVTFLILLESSKVVLMNMVALLMMLAKLATLDLLKRKVFWNGIYDVIILVPDSINKVLSHDQCLVTLAFIERSCHNFTFIRIWPEKIIFVIGLLSSSSIFWDWH